MPSTREAVASEADRLERQRGLDALKSAAERNRLGQFATPPALAEAIVRFARQQLPRRAGPLRFLDPAVGTGAFYSAALRTLGPRQISAALGVELDPPFATAARSLWSASGLQVIQQDFTRLPPPPQSERFDLVLANPPYVRHHHVPGSEKIRLRELVRRHLALEVSGLAGLYCYFLLLCDAWLEPNALSIWLIPSEFMSVGYGACLRKYLTERVCLECIHRFDPGDPQFDDALVSSAVVVFRKRPPERSHRATFSFGGTLEQPRVTQRIHVADLREVTNWTSLPTLDGSVPRCDSRTKLGDLFAIRRGLATGNNRFFVLPRSEARQQGIPDQFLRPVLPSPRHLRQEIIASRADGFPRLDRPLALIDCSLPPAELKRRHPRLWRYFERGRRKGVARGYLTSRRDPWYAQEQRPPAPYLCTYMGRNRERPFRFLWNQSQAVATNVYLLLYPQAHVQARLEQNGELAERIFAALGRIPARHFQQQGRVYGGGLYKVEPAELKQLPADSLAELLVL